MFPEGTRSRDGCPGRFEAGAFRIAQENRVPILPMAIQGTMDAPSSGLAGGADDQDFPYSAGGAPCA
jgi:1-acyl-sn-glycerol-3-phosphate acyltransferase